MPGISSNPNIKFGWFDCCLQQSKIEKSLSCRSPKLPLDQRQCALSDLATALHQDGFLFRCVFFVSCFSSLFCQCLGSFQNGSQVMETVKWPWVFQVSVVAPLVFGDEMQIVSNKQNRLVGKHKRKVRNTPSDDRPTRHCVQDR